MNTELKSLLRIPSPTSNTPDREARDSSCDTTKLIEMTFPQSKDRKRKQKLPQEDEAPLSSPAAPLQKRQRTSPQGSHNGDAIGANTAAGVSGTGINLFESWRKGVDPHRDFSPSSLPEAVEHTASKDARIPNRQRGSPEARRIGDSFGTEDTVSTRNSRVDLIYGCAIVCNFEVLRF